MKLKKIKTYLRRKRIIILNWEYWNFNVLYFPIYFYWFWLSVKARSFFFFSASNPCIKNAGFMMESKKQIYDLMPQDFFPSTALIETRFDKKAIEQIINHQKLTFPLVAKPDIGERGNAVKKLNGVEEIVEYKTNTNVNFLIQNWCNYENEIGVFFCKYPSEQKGFITGVVQKEFLSLKGDGISTVEELILENDRFFLQYDVLIKQQNINLKKVLNIGEEEIVVPYGNHCRGTKFLDVSFMIDDDLNNVFNEVCLQIPEFNFGRLDIRFKTWEDLKQGKNFSIIELNGAGSEPIHIYDPKHSVFFAWKEITKHLSILYKISKENKKLFGLNYMTFSEGLKMFKEKRKYNQLMVLNV